MDISPLQDAYRGFYIDTPQSNNAFSYDRRLNKRIYVPALVKGSVEDLKVGCEVVFSEIIDGSTECNALGLKDFIYLERPGQDVFIFDNHNHAFSCWAAGIDAGVIPLGATLVHVDQHKDTRQPDAYLGDTHQIQIGGHVPNSSFEFGTCPPIPKVCKYANEVLNVGNFILPAVKLGWFKDVIQVATADAFLIDPPRFFVLDIDLDIFASVMDHIPKYLKISRLRAWIARASFITMATSPFFMDQQEAIDLARELLK